MTKYIIILSLLMISVLAKADYGQLTSDQGKETVDAYCLNIIRPFLQQTAIKEFNWEQTQTHKKNLEQQLNELQIKNGICEYQTKDLNSRIQEQKDMIQNLRQQWVGTQVNNAICQETIRNKDILLTEQITKIANAEETFNQKYMSKINNLSEMQSQMMQHIGALSNYSKKDLINGNYENQTKALNKTIEEQKTNIKDLQHQVEELRIKNVANEETIKLLRQKIEFEIREHTVLSTSCVNKSENIYEIKLPGMNPFPVPCDTSGWTVVQRRMDGSIDFNRNWTDYVEGFGNLRTEFWIGLEKLHQLTNSQTHELYIYLKDFKNENRYARYNDFVLGSKDELYEIKQLGDYSGNAGDSMQDHKNLKFSTPDNDNVYYGGCAKAWKSGWWFNSNCYTSNLNGVYTTVDTDREKLGVDWRTWHKKPLKITQMMIRPKNK